MKIRLTNQAQEDLLSIADPLYSRILKQVRALAGYPEIGAPMTGPFVGYRSMVVGIFRIVYKIASSDEIIIAYIRDCRRKPSA